MYNKKSKDNEEKIKRKDRIKGRIHTKETEEEIKRKFVNMKH